ncbi:hypothetical protein [Streptomyces sp. NBC_00878]|uniref:hypothetical protein n=1 Tax=Streptomyces sp. NBC_00878 TaxID=2975854 RepID=UPI0022573B91|nr:hypothetical protein [Streptomyces sp. NBC_00878]MCX4906136.1 hypothetical protein [Streptomyces sp. NBC_00878]
MDGLCKYYNAVGVESESLEDALAWATEVRYDVTGLLVSGRSAGTWRAYGSLIAEAERSEKTMAIPAGVWNKAVFGPFLPATQVRWLGLKAAAQGYYRPLAEAGDPTAMYNFAVAHSLSPILRGSRAAAEGWFRKAADAGHAPAARELGLLLLAQDEAEEAEAYLKTAAAMGDGEAAYRLGLSLGNRALRWLEEAARQRSPEVEGLNSELAALLSTAVRRPRPSRGEGEPGRFLD